MFCVFGEGEYSSTAVILNSSFRFRGPEGGGLHLLKQYIGFSTRGIFRGGGDRENSTAVAALCWGAAGSIISWSGGCWFGGGWSQFSG